MANGEDGGFVEMLGKYGKDYATWLLAILTGPQGIVDKTRDINAKGETAQYLLPIVIVSIFIGATIGALIPGRPPLQSRATIFCVVSILWVFMSLLVHGVCRMFGGKATMLTTLSLMIQDLAFVYVASNFLTLILSSSAAMYQPIHILLADRLVLSSPGRILLSLQFLLLLYLVPLTVSRAHEFKGYTLILVALFAAVFAVSLGVPVLALGGC
jgi:hypothetical protein